MRKEIERRRIEKMVRVIPYRYSRDGACYELYDEVTYQSLVDGVLCTETVIEVSETVHTSRAVIGDDKWSRFVDPRTRALEAFLALLPEIEEIAADLRAETTRTA